jgi:hypothetical protein
MAGVAMACAMKMSETEEKVEFLLTGGINEERVTLPRAAIAHILYQVAICNNTVRKAKRDAGPQHKGDGKFRHPYR